MNTVNDIIEKVDKVFLSQLMFTDVELKPTTNIFDELSPDSLDHVELVMIIEEEFGIEISDSEASHCVTMSDVYKLVADKIGVGYTCGVDNKQPKEKLV